MAEQPLAGKRIVVTRSQKQAERFGRKLAALGAQPILFPVITFEPLPTKPLHTAIAQQNFDWLIFTSVNGVRFFEAAQTPLPTNVKIAAVGGATVTALQANGWVVDFRPKQFTGEQLAHGLGDVYGKSILLPRAEQGRPEIVAHLRQQGAVVIDIPLYRTIGRTATAAELASLASCYDLITFTSPSSVRNFLRIAQTVHGLVACIGPTTAAEAQKYGLNVAIIPQQYTIDSLITAIIAYYSANS